jgi:serine/threonine protein phosphatase 1
MLELIKYDHYKDQMIIIGDAIDRGKYNLEILEYIRNHESISLLKGNHEHFCQMYLEGDLEPSLWSKWGGGETLKEIDLLSEKEKQNILSYIINLEYYKVIDTCYGETLLTHAGFWADAMVESQTEQGKIDVVSSLTKGLSLDEFQCLVSNDIHYIPAADRKRMDKFIICGHVPVMRLNENGSYKIYHHPRYMCIDSGAGHRESGGRLSCYRVEDQQEFYI